MAAITNHPPDIGSYRKIKLWLNKGGYWEVRWADADAGYATKKQSTKTKIRAEAEAYLAAFCADIRGQVTAVAQALAPTVDDLCRRWLAMATGAGKTDQSAILGAIRRQLGHLAADRIDDQVLQDYASGRNVTGGTIRRELGALRTVLIWAAKQKLISRDDVPNFGDHMPPDNPPRTKFLDLNQEQFLWDQAMVVRDHRVMMFTALGLETAARREAIVDLTWDRVDLSLGQIDYRVPGRKVSKKRRVRVPISDRLMPVLKEAWLRAPKGAGGQAIGYVITGDQTRVLPKSMSTAYGRFTAKIGLGWVSPHVLRHSWASLAAMNGVSLWDIAQVMGDTIAMIERTYLHLTPGHLRSAINHKGTTGKSKPMPKRQTHRKIERLRTSSPLAGGAIERWK